MAFETRVMRNGAWVTETVSLQDALKAYNEPLNGEQKREDPVYEPVSCGILTRTIAHSPKLNQVLPVRLRSKRYNDIVFVGDHFVQVTELLEHGQTREVFSKDDFGAPIRSALALGSRPDDGLVSDGEAISPGFQGRPASPQHASTGTFDHDMKRPRSLPPQILVLILTNADLLFLFMEEQSSGVFGIRLCKHKGSQRLPGVGFHFSSNHNSRYLVAASPGRSLMLVELHSFHDMQLQYSQTGDVDPVKRITTHLMPGLIGSVQFLYPDAQDEGHNILLLLAAGISQGQTHAPRYLTFEWDLGDDLNKVFSQDSRGHRVPNTYACPTLLIPLRFQNSFLSVSEGMIGLVRNILVGSIEFETLPLEGIGPTRLHHGNSLPLWTAWARPFRLRSYYERTDIIYLAREDGVVIHIEIGANDLAPSITHIGCLETNINTAFTTAYDAFSDLLIICGDSSPGGIWKLPARSEPSQLSPLQNWSPVVDVMCTSDEFNWDNDLSTEIGTVLDQNNFKPDRLFLASGRGERGGLTEFRNGLRARIALDIDLGEPISQAWMLSDERDMGGSYAVLALPYSTIVLPLPHGDEDGSEISPSTNTLFQLGSRTLHITKLSNGIIVQVTERSITLIAPSQRSCHEFDSLLEAEGVAINQACCIDNFMVVSVPDGQQSRIFVLDVDQMDLSKGSQWNTHGHVTCLSNFSTGSVELLAIASFRDNSLSLSIYGLDGKVLSSREVTSLNEKDAETYASFEPITSLCALDMTEDSVVLLGGTRCGHLIQFRITYDSITWVAERLGRGHVDLFPASCSNRSSVFACCDDNLLKVYRAYTGTEKGLVKEIVWTVDSAEASLPSPPIHSVFSLDNEDGNTNYTSLLIVAGTRLLLTDLSPHVLPVPRTFALRGQPTRLIYSHAWQCIVVACQQSNRPTLVFLDPDTGSTISTPWDRKAKAPENFASGFGSLGDRVYGLYEWLYKKDGQTFPFIVATTKKGGLLICSVVRDNKPGSAIPIKYYTRHRKTVASGPVYSVVTDNEKLIYCGGSMLFIEEIDLFEKKLKLVKKHTLDSPATSLQVIRGKIHVVTQAHSLEIIDHRCNPESEEMELTHTDRVNREAAHMISIGPLANQSPWPLSLLSDTTGGIWGLQTPWGETNKELGLAFSGQLTSSVRRFVRGQCRQAWDWDTRKNRRFGLLMATPNGADILGVSIDGSIRHFSLLTAELARFLFLIQKLSFACPTLDPLYPERAENLSFSVPNDEGEASGVNGLHIDGDLLMRCLRLKNLEELLSRNSEISQHYYARLDALDGGAYTQEFKKSEMLEEEAKLQYIGLGYEILEYVLTPVI